MCVPVFTCRVISDYVTCSVRRLNDVDIKCINKENNTDKKLRFNIFINELIKQGEK